MTLHERRVVLAGVLTIAALVLTLRALPFVLHRTGALRTEVAAARLRLASMEHEIERGSILFDSAAALRSALGKAAPAFLLGSDEPDASAAMDRYLAQVLTRSGSKVLRSESLADSTKAGPGRRLTLRVEFETDFAGFVSVLAELIRGRPTVGISNLSIKADDPASEARKPESLQAALTVSGWYAVPADPKRAGLASLRRK